MILKSKWDLGLRDACLVLSEDSVRNFQCCYLRAWSRCFDWCTAISYYSGLPSMLQHPSFDLRLFPLDHGWNYFYHSASPHLDVVPPGRLLPRSSPASWMAFDFQSFNHIPFSTTNRPDCFVADAVSPLPNGVSISWRFCSICRPSA